jgi:predicted secreted protein
MNKKRLAIIIGIVVAAVVVAVLLDTMLANHQPAIVSLEANPEKVEPSRTCQIVCNATDSDDDELSYGWSADGGAISGEGAAVTWTAPGAVGSYNVTVIVSDSRGGTATDYVSITVRRNNVPTINNLSASPAWAQPSGSLNLTCDATDPDGDELSYEWTASGGNFSGTGPAVSWAAPQEVGVYNITVVVRDGHGTSATRILGITVATEQPPTIDQLLVTAEHCYLKTYSWGYKVGKAHEYQIECVVAGPGEFTYEWSCTGGNITGEGSMATWTAPNPSGTVDITLTVMVSDIGGNKAVKDVLLQVVSCNTCSFPGCSG